MNPDPEPGKRLLEELGHAFDRQPMPPRRVVEAAKESYLWRQAVRLRGTTGPRELTFQDSKLVIEVEDEVSGEGRRLLGRLIPAQAAHIEVRQSGVTSQVEADGTGRFSVSGLEAGLAGLHYRLAGQDPVSAGLLLL
jgi:hypothetical protein